MATPHIAAKPGDFAKVVLMPGDPLRAKFIAENFLENARLVTSVRNVLGYTGTYHGKEVSVMASGMGMPSIGIYSHELYTHYGVETIIRIGSCGSYKEDINLFDVIVCMGACTDSNWASQFQLNGTYSAIADFDLVRRAYEIANEKKTPVHVGNIFSADVFYDDYGQCHTSLGTVSVLPQWISKRHYPNRNDCFPCGLFLHYCHMRRSCSIAALFHEQDKNWPGYEMCVRKQRHGSHGRNQC